MINIILTVRRIDFVGFPSNEKTIRAGAGPTKSDLKGVMKLGEADIAVHPKTASEMRAGIADDDAELIDFSGGGYIVHRREQRNRSRASFQDLFELPRSFSDS
ncbi:MAG: hypothetical protein KGM47_01660 [Acidobacteriota bacterium]|nr:hypothetical protein [Acidobacteriota bacterium]